MTEDTALPIYLTWDTCPRKPDVWPGLEEMLAIAEGITFSSRYRKIPKKRRGSIENSGEWPLEDGRILSLTNNGSTALPRPTYILKLVRPGANGPDAVATSIEVSQTDFMSLRKSQEAVQALRFLTSAAQNAVEAIKNRPLASFSLLTEATPAMLYRPETAPKSQYRLSNMTHRAPWQDPRDILEEDPNIEYRPPEGGIAIISVSFQPFVRSISIAAVKTMIKEADYLDPMRRMLAAQKLQELASYGRPQ